MLRNKNSATDSSARQSEWVSYWESSIAGKGELILPEQFTILLVLKGEIELIFNGYIHKTISNNFMIVIDNKQLTGFTWEAGTAILEYTPPNKIIRFFISCSSAFKVPCSTIVPVLPLLQTWIDNLMADQLQPKEKLTDALRRDYCVRLGNILRSYPPLLVGELLVPFKACSISGDKKCKGEHCM